MTTNVEGIPHGASVIIPRLVCRDPAVAMDFCANAFGAVERVRRPGPDGTVAHALMTIGPAMSCSNGSGRTCRAELPNRTEAHPW
jgi:PhnB protein